MNTILQQYKEERCQLQKQLQSNQCQINWLSGIEKKHDLAYADLFNVIIEVLRESKSEKQIAT